jgi:hypothetical protein
VPAPAKGGVIAITVMKNGTILGVGANKRLYVRTSLDANWVETTHSNEVNILTIAMMNDGKILAVGDNYTTLYTCDDINGTWVTVTEKTNRVSGIAVMKDGQILGIDDNRCLLVRATLNSDWVAVANSGYVVAISVMRDGKILGIGNDYSTLYTRNGLDQAWVPAKQTGGSVFAIACIP